MITICTYGYGNKGRVSDLKGYAQLCCVIVDIRLFPTSKNPDWKKTNLENELGDYYIHIPEFGNLNYKNGGEFKLQNCVAGIKKITPLLQAHPCILLCGCSNYTICHRNYVAHGLVKVKLVDNVHHLFPGDPIPKEYLKS